MEWSGWDVRDRETWVRVERWLEWSGPGDGEDECCEMEMMRAGSNVCVQWRKCGKRE